MISTEKSIAYLIDVVKNIVHGIGENSGVDTEYCKERIDRCTKILLDSVENNKTISLKFIPLQYVVVNAVNAHGRVTEVKYNGYFVQYGVDYWMDGILKSVWCMEDEITENKKCQ